MFSSCYISRTFQKEGERGDVHHLIHLNLLISRCINMSAWPVQELSEWNARYREKFGFVFLICASGRTSDEILAELKVNFKLKFNFQPTIIW